MRYYKTTTEYKIAILYATKIAVIEKRTTVSKATGATSVSYWEYGCENPLNCEEFTVIGTMHVPYEYRRCVAWERADWYYRNVYLKRIRKMAK